jgi:histidine ammonia-lyase
MGAAAAVKARQAVHNAAAVLGIELLCACQALEMRSPLKPGPASAAILAYLRREVPVMEKDRLWNDDLHIASRMIRRGEILNAVTKIIKELPWST